MAMITAGARRRHHVIMIQVATVALVLMWIIGLARANIVLSNYSNKTVSVGNDPTNPRSANVATLQPAGPAVSLPSGAYYLANKLVVTAEMVLDGRWYVVLNSVDSPGLVTANLVALGVGTVLNQKDAVPITGDF